MTFVDNILELKSRCRIAEEIGREYRLSKREIDCISEVGKSGSMHSKTLADCVDLSASRGSRIINRLVDRGLLESEADPADRRYHNLTLSQTGADCYATIRHRKQECEERLLAGLSEEEKSTVRNGISLLLEVI